MNDSDRRALREEAWYYQLVALEEKLRYSGGVYDPSCLPMQDIEIRQDAQDVRKGFEQADKSTTIKAENLLIDLFDKDGTLAIEPNYEGSDTAASWLGEQSSSSIELTTHEKTVLISFPKLWTNSRSVLRRMVAH